MIALGMGRIMALASGHARSTIGKEIASQKARGRSSLPMIGVGIALLAAVGLASRSTIEVLAVRGLATMSMELANARVLMIRQHGEWMIRG